MKSMVMFAVTLSFVFGLSLQAPARPVQTQCPIMGYTPNEKLYVDYEGKRIYFCCASCPEKFKRDPDKYMQELKRKNVPLEEAPEQSTKPTSPHNE